jgi:hypothetical protein
MSRFLLTEEEARHRSRRRTPNLRLVRPVLGEVVDVSPLGLGIKSSSPLNVRQSYSLLVRRGVRIKRMTGRVAWCTLTKTELIGTGTTLPVFRAGIEIEHLEPSVWRFLDSEVRATSSVRH